MTRPIILAGFHRVVLAPKILAVAVTMFSAASGAPIPGRAFARMAATPLKRARSHYSGCWLSKVLHFDDRAAHGNTWSGAAGQHGEQAFFRDLVALGRSWA
ncbi:hypothetical protein [Glutamicibacter protophormiae]|uniref:hypothetical protein n=1 Tax=Glutamicibacter protophormiae TaxID=37930 RepID=UPI001959A3C6|nr:hypothetical protein [Glutamicibacter protophormiae]QRQ80130.1 hypothetical protein JQN66_08060 [Glutamicibacter protophormiae]